MVEVAKKSKRDFIETVSDVKEHKKLLRTRNNVLVVYAKSSKYYLLINNSLNTIRETRCLSRSARIRAPGRYYLNPESQPL